MKKMADEMIAKRIDISDEELRGVALTSLLAGGARLFADGGAAARQDPAGTYAQSRPVSQLDFFISHAWRAPQLAKYVALLCYFNLDAALVAYLVAALASFIPQALYFESVPSYLQMRSDFDHSGLAAQLLAPLAFGLVLFGGHAVLRRREHAFLDISCINQLDDASKAAGIHSLGALLDRSKRMVVLLDEHNMKRMWCVFEVAAFAKRGSIERMDLVPLHLALQQGALALAILCIPLTTLINMPFTAATDVPITVIMAVQLPLVTAPFVLLVYATYRGRAASAALEGLRSFTVADAECYSAVDRLALLELIGRWFADESAVEGGDAKMQSAVGVHNFETFVRMEVVSKIERTLGSSKGLRWPPILSLLFWMAQTPHYNLDKIAMPEMTMYETVCTLSIIVLGLVFVPILGAGVSLTADAIGLARDKCGCGLVSALLLIGVPGFVLSWATYFCMTMGLVNPHTFTATDSHFGLTFPDDGLEPEWTRRVVKVYVTLVATVLLVASWVSLMTGRAQGGA